MTPCWLDVLVAMQNNWHSKVQKKKTVPSNCGQEIALNEVHVHMKQDKTVTREGTQTTPDALSFSVNISSPPPVLMDKQRCGLH